MVTRKLLGTCLSCPPMAWETVFDLSLLPETVSQVDRYSPTHSRPTQVLLSAASFLDNSYCFNSLTAGPHSHLGLLFASLTLPPCCIAEQCPMGS